MLVVGDKVVVSWIDLNDPDQRRRTFHGIVEEVGYPPDNVNPKKTVRVSGGLYAGWYKEASLTKEQ